MIIISLSQFSSLDMCLLLDFHPLQTFVTNVWLSLSDKDEEHDMARSPANHSATSNCTDLVCEECNENGSVAHHPQHHDDAVHGYQGVVSHRL